MLQLMLILTIQTYQTIKLDRKIMSDLKKVKLSPEELQRKYHQNLVFNYAEYPTCDHWDYNFRSDDYKKSLVDWLKGIQMKLSFFTYIFHFVNNFVGFVLVVKLLQKVTIL